MKLLTYLQNYHGFARRKAVQLIKGGQVLVEGKQVENYQMDMQEGDLLTLYTIQDGLRDIKVSFPKNTQSQIILFHKPIGYVVSKNDPHNQTIYDILPQFLSNYDYIGRLDKDSSGLLVLTNDKKKVHELGHPSSGLKKTYLVRIDQLLSNEEIIRMKQGMWVDEDGNRGERSSDARCELLKVVSVQQQGKKGYVELVVDLVEGHKRHIRRLLKALGKKIFALHRISFGSYQLGNIAVGERVVVS